MEEVDLEAPRLERGNPALDLRRLRHEVRDDERGARFGMTPGVVLERGAELERARDLRAREHLGDGERAPPLAEDRRRRDRRRTGEEGEARGVGRAERDVAERQRERAGARELRVFWRRVHRGADVEEQVEEHFALGREPPDEQRVEPSERHPVEVAQVVAGRVRPIRLDLDARRLGAPGEAPLARTIAHAAADLKREPVEAGEGRDVECRGIHEESDRAMVPSEPSETGSESVKRRDDRGGVPVGTPHKGGTSTALVAPVSFGGAGSMAQSDS